MTWTIAIDETGDFQAGSRKPHSFVAAHVRAGKEEQFRAWEQQLPRSLKNASGEIKGSVLNDDQLQAFMVQVLRSAPRVRLSPVSIVPALNPPARMKALRDRSLAPGYDRALQARLIGNKAGADSFQKFADWYQRLSYPVFLKVVTLSHCLFNALSDAVIFSVRDDAEAELPTLEFVIDRDFVRKQAQQEHFIDNVRRVGESASRKRPIVCPREWIEEGHPFVEMYGCDEGWDFSSLYWERCSFARSHDRFELRVADVAASILRCQPATPRRVDLRDAMADLMLKDEWPCLVLGGNPSDFSSVLKRQ